MASDNPPYFQVGTNVSARYKGAFCSANVKKVKRKVKVKVQFASKPRPKLRLIMDDDVFGPLLMNSAVRAMDPDVGGLRDATVVQVIDRSIYTVVFNDGDVSTLTRSGVCTPGQRHYNAKDNLDNFPLLDPKLFSSPVVTGNQQVPTERANRRLSQPIDNVLSVTPAQSEASNLTTEVPSTSAEVTSSVMRSCRQKHAVASSSKASLPRPANRPKFVQRKKKINSKSIFPVGKPRRRKVFGHKKQGRSKRKVSANGATQQANGNDPAKQGRPKIKDLTDPAILEVIDGIQQGCRKKNRKIATAGSSILRFPIREGPGLGSSESPENPEGPNGEINETKKRVIKDCDEEAHEAIDGSDQATGNKEGNVLDTPIIYLNQIKTKAEDSLPCCSRQIRKVESNLKCRDVGYQRRTRANAARAFPTTVNEMYKELCVIVEEKNVEVPTTPPVGKRFNFVPENLDLVTDPIEKQRLIMTSLENLCVTYFGIKEHLSMLAKFPPKPKKK